MPEKIVNALTGIKTTHNVGSKDEYNYFRVMAEDGKQSKKLFYSNKGEYLYHKLVQRFKGQIEHLENSIKYKMNSIDTEWNKIERLTNKKALIKIIDLVSNEPTVTFTAVIDNPQSDWTTV